MLTTCLTQIQFGPSALKPMSLVHEGASKALSLQNPENACNSILSVFAFFEISLLICDNKNKRYLLLALVRIEKALVVF